MQEEGGLNLYGFVENDGVNIIDLLGGTPEGFIAASAPGPQRCMICHAGGMHSLAVGLRAPGDISPDEKAALQGLIGTSESNMDWQSALEELAMNNISASGTVEVGVSIPIGAVGFVDIGASVTPKIYECMDSVSKARRTQLKIELTVSVSGGIGNSVDLSKYKLPGSAGNTYQDQLRKMKQAARRPAPPRKKETTGLTNPSAYQVGGSSEREDGDGCVFCKDAWEGVVKVGPFGEASAILTADAYGFASWEHGKKFAWDNFKLGMETNFGFRFAVGVKLGVKGQGQGTWYKTIDL